MSQEFFNLVNSIIIAGSFILIFLLQRRVGRLEKAADKTSFLIQLQTLRGSRGDGFPI